MKKIKITLFSLLVWSIFSLGATKVTAEAEQLKIMTSFYPIYQLTSEVVGDLHQVEMINSGNGIHDFEPSAADIAAIYEADIFIYHSSSFESWTKNLEENKGNQAVTMIQASAGLTFKTALASDNEEEHDHEHEEDEEGNSYDLHSWIDPIEAAREAQLIAEALAKVDPNNANAYLDNAKDILNKAEKLTKDYQTIFDGKGQKTFVTQHTAFYYLAERFGLKQLGVTGISAENEPSAKQLNEVMAFVKEHQVKTIFVEPNVSDRIGQIIATSTGVEVVELSPLESDPNNDLSFLENIEVQLKTLSDHLK